MFIPIQSNDRFGFKDNQGLFSFHDFEDDWKSVCIGYSQGGSVALATHRFIEENGLADELHFAGSVCGDGPYGPVAHLGYYMNDDGETYNGSSQRTQHEKATVSMPIVMPLILKGMCDRNPFMRQHQVSDYLTAKFLRTGVIEFINAKSQDNKENQYSTDDINNAFRKMRQYGQSYPVFNDANHEWTNLFYDVSEMQQMLYKDDGDNVHGKLDQMMTQAAYSYFNGLNSNTPIPSDRGVMNDLLRALATNARVSGWTPSHRIAFYHSSYDTVVPYENLLSFIRHQDGLNYYFNSRQRSLNANVTPAHMVDKEEKADNSTIIDNYFYGQVKGSTAAGGIVGESVATDISDCAADNSIEAAIAGGIVGKAGETTKVGRCYSRNTFTATTVGGIIGQHQGDAESSISSCAYLDANSTLPVVVAADGASAITATDNRLCVTVSNMEGLKLEDLLGHDKWYYFHKDISDCLTSWL